MVAWSDLALPILLSAVLVFIASSLIHMVVKWHDSDYRKLSNEDEVRAAIRKGAPTPGQYVLPHCTHGKDANAPETARKFEEGPNAAIFLRAAGKPQIGSFLVKWFIYTIIVSAIAAYIARSTLAPGQDYLEVFQLVGVVTWLAYCWAGPADSIWVGKPWIVTFKHMFDGLIYAGLTAGAFGWLWPTGVV